MKVSIDPASDRELRSAIQKLADASGKTVKEALPAQARLFAADLAFNTRPIGKSPSEQKKGQEKVARRINEVYLDVGAAVNILKRKSESLGKAFSAMIRRKDYRAAEELINRHGGGRSRFEVGPFDGGALHQKQQFSARVTVRRVCVDKAKVAQYIRSVQKLVGFAKGGFATAARQLGGVRGIPGYATRQKAPGKGSVKGDGKTLEVTLQNDVRYIDKALDRAGEERATQHRARSINLVLRRMMDRKIKNVSQSLK